MWKSEGSEDGNREEQKMLKGKKSGVWKREKQVMLRLECGKARAMETEMWRLSKSKEKERKGRKDVFERVESKMVLRIGGCRFRLGRRILFEVEWNQLIADDWREDVKI